MKQKLTAGEQNLYLFQNLIPENEKFYIWAYDRDFSCLGTSCPTQEQEVLEYFFDLFGGKDKISALTEEEMKNPLIIGSPVGMQWAAVFHQHRADHPLLLLGPIFYSRQDENAMRNAIYQTGAKTKKGRYIASFLELSGKLPVISYAIFARYVVMVHNIINEDQISVSDLQAAAYSGETPHSSPADQRNRTEVYYSERALLSMVRNGDLSFQEVFQKSSSLSSGVNVSGKDPLRQAKTSIIVFTSLVCRAAMEGGLSPEIAYSLGDSYIQSVEDCRDSAELTTLTNAMYQDFIYRVHQLRTNPALSHPIRKCCDFIELNLNRRIRIKDLADLVGYSEYYLSEKFKTETGMSINTYIRFAKIEKAKVLLEATDFSINEIADRLAFNTPNYFIQSFRDTTGSTPARYRAEKRRQSEA